jgi:hypothetical protein
MLRVIEVTALLAVLSSGGVQGFNVPGKSLSRGYKSRVSSSSLHMTATVDPPTKTKKVDPVEFKKPAESNAQLLYDPVR